MSSSPDGAVPATDKRKPVLTIKEIKDEKDVFMSYGNYALLRISGKGAVGGI
jgi:hypothetical protein